MLLDFLDALRAHRLPVSTKELLALLEALEAGVIGPSIEDFYHLSRTVLIKDEKHYDRFDCAFGAYFNGIESVVGAEGSIPEDWLRQTMKRVLSPEEIARLEKLGWDKLLDEFRKRLAEQTGRHEGGSMRAWWVYRAVKDCGEGSAKPQQEIILEAP